MRGAWPLAFLCMPSSITCALMNATNINGCIASATSDTGSNTCTICTVEKSLDAIEEAQRTRTRIQPHVDHEVHRVWAVVRNRSDLMLCDAAALAQMYTLRPALFNGIDDLTASPVFLKELTAHLRRGLSLDILLHFKAPFALHYVFETWCELVCSTQIDRTPFLRRMRHADLHYNMAAIVKHGLLDAVMAALEVEDPAAVIRNYAMHNRNRDVLEITMMAVDMSSIGADGAVQIAEALNGRALRKPCRRFIHRALSISTSYELPMVLRQLPLAGLDAAVESDVVSIHGAHWVFAVLLFERERRRHYKASIDFDQRVNAALQKVFAEHNITDLSQCIAAAISNMHPAIAFFVQSVGTLRRDMVKGVYELNLDTARGVVDDMLYVSYDRHGNKSYMAWDMALFQMAALGTTRSTPEARDYIGTVMDEGVIRHIHNGDIE